ncbi:N-acetylmuramoyl-L-alanine amidase [Sutcliffiella horikoshii]|uniref:N-acetylmuramoyl-L-alanine amidase n=1 Tax=Sutcliffiella horikoshii TaxID=79883 RepID=UPI003CF68366
MLIYLDAGHGGRDSRGNPVTPGKRTPDGSMLEWEFNSKVAEYVEAELKNYQNVTVKRSDDRTGRTDVSLSERTNRANRDKASVFVSIHANGYGLGWNSANGIETFVYITKPAGAVKLANLVQKHMVNDTGRANRRVKSANFAVLRTSNMTAILCECGFMTNRDEATLLKSDSYRRKIAHAIVKGLVECYGLKPIKKEPETPKQSPGGNVFYRVVTGSFLEKSNGLERIEELKKKNFSSFLDAYEKNGKTYFRCITGSFTSRKNALERMASLDRAGFDSFLDLYKK